MSDVIQGTIKKITDRGFGFIKADGMDRDVFFHAKGLADGVKLHQLLVGDVVEFEIQEQERGMNAVNVRLVQK